MVSAGSTLSLLFLLGFDTAGVQDSLVLTLLLALLGSGVTTALVELQLLIKVLVSLEALAPDVDGVWVMAEPVGVSWSPSSSSASSFLARNLSSTLLKLSTDVQSTNSRADFVDWNLSNLTPFPVLLHLTFMIPSRLDWLKFITGPKSLAGPCLKARKNSFSFPFRTKDQDMLKSVFR